MCLAHLLCMSCHGGVVQAVLTRLNGLVRNRNLTGGSEPAPDANGEKGGGSREDGGEGGSDALPSGAILSEIERFRQAQAERDRKLDEEKKEKLRRRIEEQERLEKEKVRLDRGRGGERSKCLPACCVLVV